VTTRIPAQDLAVLGRANPDAVGHFKTEMTTGRSTLFYGFRNQTLYADDRPKGTHNILLHEHPEIIQEIVPPEVYQRYRAGEFFDQKKGGQAWEVVASFALLGRLGGVVAPGGHYNVVSIWPRSLAGVPGKLEPVHGLLDKALPGLLRALKGEGRIVCYGMPMQIDDDWIVVVEGELGPLAVGEYLAGHAG
jgi:hypothetical protein